MNQGYRGGEQWSCEAKGGTKLKIGIHRTDTSLAIDYPDAVNAYTKDQMYCVLLEEDGERTVHKYPLCSIFRVTEEYGE